MDKKELKRSISIRCSNRNPDLIIKLEEIARKEKRGLNNLIEAVLSEFIHKYEGKS